MFYELSRRTGEEIIKPGHKETGNYFNNSVLMD